MANNRNQYKFKEGEVHQFTISGYTEIPNTDESFFILTNSFGGKHLLKAIHFDHYNLEKDQVINCKIDKINCSGKIYLEPENPVYKEGDAYNFKFLKIIDHINSVGEKEKVALVQDQFGEEVICSLPKDCKLSTNIKNLQCKVLRIKKGKLYLSLSESTESDLIIGQKYGFNVVEVKKLEKQEDYYILHDEFGSLYSLKKDMYQHYGLEIGQEVECTVTKYNVDGHLKIEPVHPHYKTGKAYSFKYVRTETDSDVLGNEEKVVIVKDIYGVETKVRSKSLNFSEPFPEYINCKVEGIRKGKAILSIA